MSVFRAVRSVDEMLMKIVVCVAGRSMLIAWVRVGRRLVAAVLQTRARSGGLVEGTMADVSLLLFHLFTNIFILMTLTTLHGAGLLLLRVGLTRAR